MCIRSSQPMARAQPCTSLPSLLQPEHLETLPDVGPRRKPTSPPRPPAPMTSQPRRDGSQNEVSRRRLAAALPNALRRFAGRTMPGSLPNDLRLLLLTITGYFPSHTLRNFVYDGSA